MRKFHVFRSLLVFCLLCCFTLAVPSMVHADPCRHDIPELQREAQAGDAWAQAEVGVCYIRGKGVPEDSSRGAEWLKKAAKQGNKLGLALTYLNGLGVPKDERRGVALLQKAAKQGSASAQILMGVMYYDGGGGLPKNVRRAEEWWQKAAGQGHEEAQELLQTLRGR